MRPHSSQSNYWTGLTQAIGVAHDALTGQLMVLFSALLILLLERGQERNKLLGGLQIE